MNSKYVIIPALIFALTLLMGTVCFAQDATLDASINKQVQSVFDVYKDVKVSTKDGVVTLSGTVPDAKALSNAALVAKDVPGVKAVQNNLEIKPSTQVATDLIADEAIAKTLREKLDMESKLMGAHNIDFSVSNQVVTLTGNVEHIAQASLAEALAFRISGVKSVVSNLEIKNP